MYSYIYVLEVTKRIICAAMDAKNGEVTVENEAMSMEIANKYNYKRWRVLVLLL